MLTPGNVQVGNLGSYEGRFLRSSFSLTNLLYSSNKFIQ